MLFSHDRAEVYEHLLWLYPWPTITEGIDTPPEMSIVFTRAGFPHARSQIPLPTVVSDPECKFACLEVRPHRFISVRSACLDRFEHSVW